jgi:hypothetical protein
MSTERAEAVPEKTKPLILVASDHVPESSLSSLIEASRSVGAGLLQWRAPMQTAPSRAPALVVASLPVGSRRVPDDVVELVTQRFPELPLLLLCQEALVRPTVTAEAGRVTLVGPPHSRSKLGARLRMLLARTDEAALLEPATRAEPNASPTAAAGARSSRRTQTREYRRPEYWVSAFGTGDSPGPPIPSVVLDRREASGLTMLLSEPRADACDLEQLTHALARPESDDDKEAALCELLGGRSALLHLTPDADEWIAYLPRRDWSLCLFSPQRLPHHTDLLRTFELSQCCMLRLRAAPGDVMAALTADFGLWERPSGRDAFGDGGPALLELLCSGTLEVEAGFAGTIAEVL